MRRLIRNRLLAGFVAVAVLVPSVVLASHAWPDVPDGKFYAEAVLWAQTNGMTTGCEGGTNFCPERGVTRGENLTYAKRYDDLVVQPALDDIRAEIAANPGPQGPAGANGTNGAAGADGTDGADGAAGTNGTNGAAGVDAESPARVVWVADDGTGDFLLLSAALTSIIDASASNPYVVRIAPGVYTETSTVALKTYVDVEGSGQGITTITCECANAAVGASAATVSAGNIVAEIRHLTINNTGGNIRSIGVYTEAVVDGSVSMLHVTATATDGTGTNRSYGVFNSSSSPSMTDVTATATGGVINYGVHNQGSSPSMTDVTATATGTSLSYGVYNSSSSPSMMNVTATATGGTLNRGVYNTSSSPSMTNVTATATDGTTNYGVFNQGSSSSPSMMNVTATATGGTNSYGVSNSGSSPSMTDVTATATGGATANYGVYNADSSPSIRNSSITGTTNSIYNDTSTALVAYTMLEGGSVSGAGFTCLGAYDENLEELLTSCMPFIPSP